LEGVNPAARHRKRGNLQDSWGFQIFQSFEISGPVFEISGPVFEFGLHLFEILGAALNSSCARKFGVIAVFSQLNGDSRVLGAAGVVRLPWSWGGISPELHPYSLYP